MKWRHHFTTWADIFFKNIFWCILHVRHILSLCILITSRKALSSQALNRKSISAFSTIYHLIAKLNPYNGDRMSDIGSNKLTTRLRWHVALSLIRNQVDRLHANCSELGLFSLLKHSQSVKNLLFLILHKAQSARSSVKIPAQTISTTIINFITCFGF